MRPYVFGALAWAAVLLACGARTDPGGRAFDGGLDAEADVRVRRDADADAPGACCSSAVNEGTDPLSNCFQGATYLAFAVTPACDVPFARIEVHTNAVWLGIAADGGAGPGAALSTPVTPTVPQPGWSAVDLSLTLKGGTRYFVLIGNDHKAPGVGCDYGTSGEDVEYWGGELGGPWNGPFFAPYVVRLVARCE